MKRRRFTSGYLDTPRRRAGPARPRTKPAEGLSARPGAPRAHVNVWTVRRAPGRCPHRGLLGLAGRTVPCALGRAGITLVKREGDGATPAGRLALLGGFFRRDRLPRHVAFRGLVEIRPDDAWCDDPAHPAYNRPVRLPFAAGHEVMFRPDPFYDVCLVLDWNLTRRIRSRGSAIFLHLATDEFGPTQGCVAVSARIMPLLLQRAGSHTVLQVLP